MRGILIFSQLIGIAVFTQLLWTSSAIIIDDSNAPPLPETSQGRGAGLFINLQTNLPSMSILAQGDIFASEDGFLTPVLFNALGLKGPSLGQLLDNYCMSIRVMNQMTRW